MKHMLEEWTALGPAGVEAKARLWTWHYATVYGRAYRRSGGRCSGLAMLASLIKADPQVSDKLACIALAALMLSSMATLRACVRPCRCEAKCGRRCWWPTGLVVKRTA
jgi:hypothetical protein